MLIFMTRWIYIFSLFFLLASCTTPSKQASSACSNAYAQGFAIDYLESGALMVTVFSPWQEGQIQAQYTIVEPYTSLVTTSATHVGFLDALDAVSSLAGVCDKPLIYSPSVTSLPDVGSAMVIDPERVLTTGAQAVLLSSYSADDRNAERLAQVGVEVLHFNEWQEQHPLGRAEWIRVIGAFTGRLHEADSVFEVVREAYESLVTAEQNGPSVVSGGSYRGTWYVPSGVTYMGRLFRDAGADYAFASDSTNGSIPLTMEQAVMCFEKADVWVGAPARTLSQLADMDERHTWFRSYRNKRVYTFDARTTASGGNDFWESGVVHPERILSDMQAMLRGDTIGMVYAAPLADF